MQRVRKALNYLKSLGPVYTTLFHPRARLAKELRQKAVYLDVSGDDIRVYHSDTEVVAAVMQRGQKVIHLLIIDVKRVREELRMQLGHSEEPEAVTRMVKKLMRPRACSISGALRAVHGTGSGLHALCLG